MHDHSYKILFTGGGSAGHVTPNLALIEKFHDAGWQISYLGSRSGMEKGLITQLEIPYYAIITGKLRRYISWRNLFDPLCVVCGIFQALFFCLKLRPHVVFSKGGFVSLPVVIAAWLLRIPRVIHESDLTVGLTNRLCLPLANRVCVTFPETAKQLSKCKQVLVTGTPVRRDFFGEDAVRGRELCSFTATRKILAVFGGSLGAKRINTVIRELLPCLLENFQVVHICGKNNIAQHLQLAGYRQFEYLVTELPYVLAAADLVIARAGANSIYELLVLRKPNILLPLPAIASRGDQLANAKYCCARGYSSMLIDEQLTAKSLLSQIAFVEEHSADMIRAMEQFVVLPAVDLIYQAVEKLVDDSCARG